MEVGEMKVATEQDFDKVWQMVMLDNTWKLEYEYEDVNVWSKNSNSNIKMVKIKSTAFHDIDMWELFDVIMDGDYRPLWDTNMIESYTVGYINSNNDVGYYSMSCPTPIQNRDFVLQRSWLASPKKITIFNHSVDYAELPPKKYFIRGISYLTGYVIEPLPGKAKGCTLWYISATDPRGFIPMWAVNKGTQYFAPRMMKAMRKACEGYASWKSQNSPGFKPWVYPEQLDMTKQIEPDPEDKP